MITKRFIELNKYKYIVTGATGYVGNVIVKKLLDYNLDVVGIDINTDNLDAIFKGYKVDIINGDIRYKEDIKKLFIGDKPFVIFNAAALISIGEVKFDELVETNVNGTLNMLEEAYDHNTYRFFQISSSEAIEEGIKLNNDLSNYVPRPNKIRKGYNRSKSMADKLVFDYIEKGLNASILIISGVLGPGDYRISHMSQMFIDYYNELLPASIKGGYNDFDIRDMMDVLDNIILDSKNETYLFANRPDTIDEMLVMISEKYNVKRIKTLPMFLAYIGLPFLYLKSVFKKERPLYTLSSLKSLVQDVDYDISKVTKEFNYHPRDLKDTVIDHMEFYINENIIKRKGE